MCDLVKTRKIRASQMFNPVKPEEGEISIPWYVR